MPVKLDDVRRWADTLAFGLSALLLLPQLLRSPSRTIDRLALRIELGERSKARVGLEPLDSATSHQPIGLASRITFVVVCLYLLSLSIRVFAVGELRALIPLEIDRPLPPLSDRIAEFLEIFVRIDAVSVSVTVLAIALLALDRLALVRLGRDRLASYARVSAFLLMVVPMTALLVALLRGAWGYAVMTYAAPRLALGERIWGPWATVVDVAIAALSVIMPMILAVAAFRHTSRVRRTLLALVAPLLVAIVWSVPGIVALLSYGPALRSEAVSATIDESRQAFVLQIRLSNVGRRAKPITFDVRHLQVGLRWWDEQDRRPVTIAELRQLSAIFLCMVEVFGGTLFATLLNVAEMPSHGVPLTITVKKAETILLHGPVPKTAVVIRINPDDTLDIALDMDLSTQTPPDQLDRWKELPASVAKISFPPEALQQWTLTQREDRQRECWPLRSSDRYVFEAGLVISETLRGQAISSRFSSRVLPTCVRGQTGPIVLRPPQ